MVYEHSLTIPDELIRERNKLVTKINKGKFWKPCPGTGEGYYCCGYQILTPLTGCGMYCSYCVLQVYYDYHYQVLYENYSDLVREVQQRMEKWKGVVRFGTGEFGDSLYLEKQVGLSGKIAQLLEPYPNVLVEFKTKSTVIEPLADINNPLKVVVGFSMNTPYIIAQCEKGTSSLEDRLQAARKAEEMGFWVAFHFDPMVWYPRWREEYLAVVDRIFNTIKNPEKIAWWSLGGFRTTPSLKSRLRAYNAHLPLFSGEMVMGRDKKLRYFRPIRSDFYATMQERINVFYPECTLYLCMESQDVWEEAGMLHRIPNGLVRYLDTRAEVMLGLRKEKHVP